MNTKRTNRYLAAQKVTKSLMSKARSIALSCAAPASFPDSGYFWGQKEREYDRLERKIQQRTSPKQFRKWLNSVAVACQKVTDEYYTPIVKGIDGHMYSPADMDRMMAYGG